MGGQLRNALFRTCAIVLMAVVAVGCGFAPRPKSGTVACKPQKGSCCPAGYLCVGRGLSTAGGPSAGVCWDQSELPPEALTGLHDYTPGVLSDPPCQVTNWVPPDLLPSLPDAAVVGPPVDPNQPDPGPVAPVAVDAGNPADPPSTVLSRSIATGAYRSYAVIQGGLWRWGANLGRTAGTPPELSPVLFPGFETGVTAVFAGDYVTCFVLYGKLQCWGRNADGQLGDGTHTGRVAPVPVVGLGAGVTAVAFGDVHTCAVVNGGAWCWGDNSSGQLGNGTFKNSSSPVKVSGLGSGVTAISAGIAYSCALVNGGVRCWGDAAVYGVLGDGSEMPHETPVKVYGLQSGVTGMSGFFMHTCAVVNHSTVKCWGRNNLGQLGDGTKVDASTPVPVLGLLGNVTGIAAGQNNTCAIVDDGVRCWGTGSEYTLGGPIPAGEAASHVKGLTSSVVEIAVAFNHACARVASGVQCWGANDDGQLGIGDKARSNLDAVSVLFP